MSKPRLSTRQELRDAQIMPTRVHVLIRRDMAEELGETVYAHEVDVLAEVHGEGNVKIVDPMEFNIMIADPETIEAGRAETKRAAAARQRVPAFHFIPEHPDRPVFLGEELERLRSVYGMHHEEKKFFVDVVYPSERDLLDACGGAYKAKDAA